MKNTPSGNSPDGYVLRRRSDGPTMRPQFGTVRRTQRLPATIGLEIHLGPAVHGTPGEEWISEVGIYSVCDSTTARIHTE